MMNAEFRNYGRARELFLPFVEGNERSSSGFIYILAQYYLGLANEGLNRKEDAITNYSEVLKYWKNADIETKELKDARERLARLSA
jgi:hypothetical protein